MTALRERRDTLNTLAYILALALYAMRCARPGRLQFVEPVTPASTETPADSAVAQREQLFAALFGDTLVGFKAGSADSSRRFLGRLRDGYTVDTLNVMIFGDNRPSFRSVKLKPQLQAIRGLASLNPLNWVKGIVNIPILLRFRFRQRARVSRRLRNGTQRPRCTPYPIPRPASAFWKLRLPTCSPRRNERRAHTVNSGGSGSHEFEPTNRSLGVAPTGGADCSATTPRHFSRKYARFFSIAAR